MSVSSNRRLIFDALVVDLIVNHGKDVTKAVWNLSIAERKMRFAMGNEVLHFFAWHNFMGSATPARFKTVKEWVLENKVTADEWEHISLAMSQLNKSIKKDSVTLF
jgi:hypothetical protein